MIDNKKYAVNLRIHISQVQSILVFTSHQHAGREGSQSDKLPSIPGLSKSYEHERNLEPEHWQTTSVHNENTDDANHSGRLLINFTITEQNNPYYTSVPFTHPSLLLPSVINHYECTTPCFSARPYHQTMHSTLHGFGSLQT